jgi:protein-S-isoprenylcysteine O-methyltransferase Ste14
LLTIIPLTLVFAWRLLDEEMFLAKNMPDYVGYRNKVRYRLAPLVW